MPLAVSLALLLSLSPLALHANTPVSIPFNMSQGGTVGSPYLYLIDTTNVDYDAITILGNDSAYNQLTIKNGHSLTATKSGYIGYNVNGHNNKAIVTGAGSLWSTVQTFYVGDTGASNNTLAVTLGGRVSSRQVYIGSHSGNNNSAQLSGSSSRWDTFQTFVGNDDSTSGLGRGTGGTGNTLLIKNEALVTISNSNVASLNISSSNSILLDGGFLAWNGDHTTDIANLITGGSIKYTTDGVNYITGSTSDFSYQWFNGDDTAAQNFSGYSGLGNYTILTASASAVPEPATYAALLGLFTLGAAMMRKRRSLGARASLQETLIISR